MTHPIASDDSRRPVGQIRNDYKCSQSDDYKRSHGVYYKRSNTFDHKRSHCKSRRGAVLIVAIVCLSIATAIATAGVRHALMARRQARLDHQLRQTELLLDAGLRRAIKALSVDPDYQGERWALDPALSRFAGTFEGATVEIKASAQDGGQRVFEVTAAIGPASNPAYQTKRSHRFPYPPPDSR
jgi:hypothetical protein